MKKLFAVLFVSLMLATGAAYAEADKQSPLTEQQAVQLVKEGKPLYSCPMHTHVFSDKAGRCPICGMNLTQAKSIQSGEAVFDSGEQNMMEKK